MRADTVVNVVLAFAIAMVVLTLGAMLDLEPLNAHADELARQERAQMAEMAARKVMLERRAQERAAASARHDQGERHAEAR
jgi:hypothetical protein